MTLNDPIVQWGLGAAGAVAAWVVRTHIVKQDRRVTALETTVALLQVQMAGHDANKDMLDRMYRELQDLSKLTNRIAGHLKID